MQKAFIIHGYGATPQDHWFPWLAQQLQDAGLAVSPPAMPDAEQPDFARWQEAFATHIGTADAQTLFIAHSLGTISLLHYLSATRPAQLGGIVLVAGFGARLPELPTIGGFAIDAYIDQARLDDAALRALTPHTHHLISSNDYVVAPANSEALAARLGGTVHRVADAGHFLAADGITTLPTVWQAVQDCLHGRAG